MFRFLRPLRSVLNPNFVILQSKTLIAPFSSDSERVIAFFKNHGLTETQISKITRVQPPLLSANLDKSIAPKIDFFLSIGISKTDLPKFLFHNAVVLSRSLEQHLIPCHNLLKSVLVRDENVVKVLMRKSKILRYNVSKCIACNINLLTEIGVPKTQISFMLLVFPDAVCHTHVRFKRNVELVIGRGFQPAWNRFIIALSVFGRVTKINWDRKVMVFKSWGLSDDDVGIAFLAHPHCMDLSEERITKAMDLFVNIMGYEAADVVSFSCLLSYDLKNRTEPRCRVVKLLISKGLLEKTITLSSFLMIPETKFLERFVREYEDKVPGLLNIYQERQSI